MAKFAAEIEGEIQSVKGDGQGGAVMVVMGMTVVITKEAALKHRIRTPVNKKPITMEQLIDTSPLPGRTEEGFKGGTAIVKGNFDPASGKIEVTFNPEPDPVQNIEVFPFENHPFVEVGPPENVILGPFTGNALAGKLSVNGVEIKLLGVDFPNDGRLDDDPPSNEFGFAIDIKKTIPKNAPTSVEGYMANTPADAGKFVGVKFVVDSLDLTLIVNDKPQVSITRAQARNLDTEYELDLRGGITTPANIPIGARPTLKLEGMALESTEWMLIEGNVPSARQLTPGGFAKWRYRTTRPGSAPERVRVSINNIPDQTPFPKKFLDITEK